ncbi:uncharacterized protein SAPINGB_P002126 [Magnusiomyces paraingens]|uniref:Protein yippee-like n=1 Tax=Magnusiomyces paraingens TaxID=2606893 RepID=A0A5E8BHY7_9ASCO|nr:uncharacterized protein SAPINGB_P002126 [Saprochaete ingens]VVT49146.1 unnamed protein product [Saprochaete ingens]
MGVQFNKYLSGSQIYCCKNCRTHLAFDHDVESRDFTGVLGKAYLITYLVNVTFGPLETRPMMTGEFQVRDVACRFCSKNVGWIYVESFKSSEKYKVGKYILETRAIDTIRG